MWQTTLPSFDAAADNFAAPTHRCWWWESIAVAVLDPAEVADTAH